MFCILKFTFLFLYISAEDHFTQMILITWVLKSINAQ